MLSVFYVFAISFSVRFIGSSVATVPPYYITEALSPLRPHEPVHVDVVSARFFDDEYTIDTTVYTKQGTMHKASVRAPSLLSALHMVSQDLTKQMARQRSK